MAKQPAPRARHQQSVDPAPPLTVAWGSWSGDPASLSALLASVEKDASYALVITPEHDADALPPSRAITAAAGVAVERGHVYRVPASARLTFERGRFEPLERLPRGGDGLHALGHALIQWAGP